MFEIRPAGLKGLGIFATSLIPRGTRILSEAPLFGIRRDQGPQDVYPVFRQLNAQDRLKLLQLSNHATTEFDVTRWAHVAWYTLRQTGEFGLSTLLRRDVRLPWIWPRWHNLQEHKGVLNIFRTNCFTLNSKSAFSHAIFPSIARLNHACVPNAQGNFDDGRGTLNVHALKDIVPGSEVTLSYLEDNNGMLRVERIANLKSYGFECACPICVPGSQLAERSEERRQNIRKTLSIFAQDHAMLDERLRADKEIEVLMTMIRLLKEEGFAGRELAAMYFEAARLNELAGRLDEAVECAETGLGFDEVCLGTDSVKFQESLEKVRRLKG